MKKLLITLLIVGFITTVFAGQLTVYKPWTTKTITATAACTVSMATKAATFVMFFCKTDTLGAPMAGTWLKWEFSPDNSHWTAGGTIKDTIDIATNGSYVRESIYEVRVGVYPYTRLILIGKRAATSAKLTVYYSVYVP